ncbi:MAG TPA: hypothetical protein VGS80_11440 [Ktedonobacterales bacterium]|nr:hypothetical protein [Ktedonobacterales bacterium]
MTEVPPVIRAARAELSPHMGAMPAAWQRCDHALRAAAVEANVAMRASPEDLIKILPQLPARMQKRIVAVRLEIRRQLDKIAAGA